MARSPNQHFKLTNLEELTTTHQTKASLKINENNSIHEERPFRKIMEPPRGFKIQFSGFHSLRNRSNESLNLSTLHVSIFGPVSLMALALHPRSPEISSSLSQPGAILAAHTPHAWRKRSVGTWEAGKSTTCPDSLQFDLDTLKYH